MLSLNEGRIEKKEFRQAERAITGRYIAVSASLQLARNCPWQSGGERGCPPRGKDLGVGWRCCKFESQSGEGGVGVGVGVGCN